MEICIGSRLKELRKRDGMTQEQLAEKLNISPQAISRWECDTAYPDITMMPILANIFSVSIDTLIGYDKTKIAEQVEEIIRRASYHFWSDAEKCEKILSDALCEYPDNDKLLRELLSLYECHLRTEGRLAYAEKAQKIAHKLIAESRDIFCVCSAKNDLASIYLIQGHYDEAKALVESLPYMYPYLLNDRMRTSSYLLKGEDKLKEAKDWKVIETQELFIACDMEGVAYFEIGNYENALKSFIECKDVIERFMIGDKLCPEAYPIIGTQANHMACYLHMAGCYFNLGQLEDCENAIERAYEIVSQASSNDFKENPDKYMKEYYRIYREYGLEKYRPIEK